MYNSYAHDKKEKQLKDEKKRAIKQAKLDIAKGKRDDIMLKNYWKRVENFMIQMVENPIKQNEKKLESINDHKFRDEHPNKFLGNALLVIKGFKDEKERIKESIQNFKRLEIGAEVKKHQFRDRDLSKEFQPEMKFGLNNFATKNKEKFLPSVYGKNAEEWTRNKNWMDKNKEYHDINIKTHFRGLETYYNKLTGGKAPGVGDKGIFYIVKTY